MFFRRFKDLKPEKSLKMARILLSAKHTIYSKSIVEIRFKYYQFNSKEIPGLCNALILALDSLGLDSFSNFKIFEVHHLYTYVVLIHCYYFDHRTSVTVVITNTRSHC